MASASAPAFNGTWILTTNIASGGRLEVVLALAWLMPPIAAAEEVSWLIVTMCMPPILSVISLVMPGNV
eukprot:scaffold15879_cov66-Phaeocystis_antarctica.AAC.2